MSEADESLPKSERPTLKFPVGDELLPGDTPKIVEDILINPGPPQKEPEELEIRATSNPGPAPEDLEKEVGTYVNTGPVQSHDVEPIDSPKINPGPPRERPPRVNTGPPVIPPTANPGPPPKTNPGPPQS
jgi:hypothetical protein